MPVSQIVAEFPVSVTVPPLVVIPRVLVFEEEKVVVVKENEPRASVPDDSVVPPVVGATTIAPSKVYVAFPLNVTGNPNVLPFGVMERLDVEEIVSVLDPVPTVMPDDVVNVVPYNVNATFDQVPEKPVKFRL